jgi:hypothetical protein
MEWLEATFEFALEDLPVFMLAEGTKTAIDLAAKVDGCNVEMKLSAGASMGHADHNVLRSVLSQVHARVRAEYLTSDDPQFQTTYWAVRERFHQALLVVLNRAASYFRFILRNPAARPVRFGDVFQQKGFYRPSWTRDGEPYAFGPAKEWGPDAVPLGHGSGLLHITDYGVKKLQDSDHAMLVDYMAEERATDLFNELLSNAQSAALAGTIPRAVLELALAVEVFVKRSFFGNDPVAYAAFDVVDKARSVPVTVLISEAATRAFGASFKGERKKHFDSIKLLFDARNNVAHRGLAEFFPPDKNMRRAVQVSDLKEWWKSVLELEEWLTAKLRAARS